MKCPKHGCELKHLFLHQSLYCPQCEDKRKEAERILCLGEKKLNLGLVYHAVLHKDWDYTLFNDEAHAYRTYKLALRAADNLGSEYRVCSIETLFKIDKEDWNLSSGEFPRKLEVIQAKAAFPGKRNIATIARFHGWGFSVNAVQYFLPKRQKRGFSISFKTPKKP